MKKINLSVILVSVFLILPFMIKAQRIKGSGNVITETRKVEGFTGLRVRSLVEVELRQGAFAIEVEAEDNVIEYVETRLVKDKLIVELDDIKLKSEINPKVYITLPELIFAEVTDAAKLSSKTVIKTAELRLEANSASESNFILDCKDLRVDLSGSAKLRITGYAVKQVIKMQEAASYDASKLNSENIDLFGSGASKAEILSHDKIFGDLSEASKCKYYGEPKKVDIVTSDAAETEHIK